MILVTALWLFVYDCQRADHLVADVVPAGLCFPFIFRGALDVGATTINEAMKLAAVRAIAELARLAVSDLVARAYGGRSFSFGPEYLSQPHLIRD